MTRLAALTAPALALLPDEIPTGPYWEEIWSAYVGGASDVAMRQLAKEEGVAYREVLRRARLERWEEQRQALAAARAARFSRAA